MLFAGINHNVDELLVGILTQLQLRKHRVKHSEKTNKVSEDLRTFELLNFLVFRFWISLVEFSVSRQTRTNPAVTSISSDLWTVKICEVYKSE